MRPIVACSRTMMRGDTAGLDYEWGEVVGRRELVTAGYTCSGGSHMNLRARTGGRSAVNPKPVQTLLIATNG